MKRIAPAHVSSFGHTGVPLSHSITSMHPPISGPSTRPAPWSQRHPVEGVRARRRDWFAGSLHSSRSTVQPSVFGRHFANGLAENSVRRTESHEIPMHAAVLRKPGHERGTIEGRHASGHAGEVGHRRVRITHENLRVGPEHAEVEERKDSNRIVATDGRDDRANRSVCERLHQVVRPGLRIRRDPRGVAQRVPRLNDTAPKLFFELPFSCRVTMRAGAGATPREGHRGDCVAWTQARGFDGRTQRWHCPLQSRVDGSDSSALPVPLDAGEREQQC